MDPVYNLFLAFANLGGLESLNSFIDAIKAHDLSVLGNATSPCDQGATVTSYRVILPPFFLFDISRMAKTIMELADMGETNATLLLWRSNRGQQEQKYFERAFDVLYAFRERSCESCFFGELTGGISDETDLETCFACRHLAFRNFLIQIINNEDSAVTGFDHYVGTRNRLVSKRLGSTDHSPISIQEWPQFNQWFLLNEAVLDFFDAVAGYGFLEFLQKEKPGKLKWCMQCGRFYIGKQTLGHRAKTYCSDKCRKQNYNASDKAKELKREIAKRERAKGNPSYYP